jgi:hypothetical protein
MIKFNEKITLKDLIGGKKIKKKNQMDKRNSLEAR